MLEIKFKIAVLISLFLANCQSSDISCVSTAFISCSLQQDQRQLILSSPPSPTQSEDEEAGLDQSPSMLTSVAPASFSEVAGSDDYARCPFAVYECLKQREAACPLVRKFIANLQAVCEPERRKYIAEFQLCSAAVESECGASAGDHDENTMLLLSNNNNNMIDDQMNDDDDGEGDDDYGSDGAGGNGNQLMLDDVGRETLLAAKCDSVRRRHTCAHEVFVKERCSAEAINYFENQILQDLHDQGLNSTLCPLTSGSLTNEQHVADGSRQQQIVMGYNDEPSRQGKPTNLNVMLAGDNASDGKSKQQQQYINEVPYALKRELKSNSNQDANSSSSPFTSSALLSSLLVALSLAPFFNYYC